MKSKRCLVAPLLSAGYETKRNSKEICISVARYNCLTPRSSTLNGQWNGRLSVSISNKERKKNASKIHSIFAIIPHSKSRMKSIVPQFAFESGLEFEFFRRLVYSHERNVSFSGEHEVFFQGMLQEVMFIRRAQRGQRINLHKKPVTDLMSSQFDRTSRWQEAATD